MVKVQWLAHAAFLIQGEGQRIITDPYDPEEVDLPPINEAADLVIRSSDDDIAHCYVDTIPPGFELVTATEIVETGAQVGGRKVTAIWSQESVAHKENPKDNAMYRFTVGGVNFTHMGDVGNPLTSGQMAALAGTDVLLALAGGPPTIELDDLVDVINTVKPRLVIPMHYRIPGPQFFMLPVTELTDRFPTAAVSWIDDSSITLSPDTLPEGTTIYVLQPTLSGAPA